MIFTSQTARSSLLICKALSLMTGFLIFISSTPLYTQNLISPIHVSHTRGFYDVPFQLTLSTDTENAHIFYTLDGSDPAPDTGTLYQQPIQVNTTTILRAIAAVSADLTTVSVTHSYIFLDDVINQPNNPPGYPDTWGPYTAIPGTAVADYEMDPEITQDARYSPYIKQALLSIPTMSLVTKKENLFSHSTDPDEGGIYIYTGPPEAGDVPGLGDGWERPASIELITADGSEEFQVNCGVRLQGGHSRRPEKSPKHSFRLVFKEKYGPTRLEYPLFGENATTSFNTVSLRAGFGNKWIHWSHEERRRGQYDRDVWAKDSQLEMGHPAGHGRHVHLYVNGLYWGLYNPTERLDREFAESYLDGDESEFDVIKDYADVVDGNITAWDEMMQLARLGLGSNESYQRIQGNNPDGSPNPNYKAYVNVVNLIDYMILNFYGGNTDWDHHNWVAIRNRVNPGKGFRFFSWDAEHVLKSRNENVTNEFNNNCPSEIFQRLAENPDFRRLFADRVQFHCFNGGAMTPETITERWMKRANFINLAVIAESARWGDYRRDVHPYQTQGPFDLYDKQYWLEEQDYLLNDYFPYRTDILIEQLQSAGLFPGLAAPNFSLNGGPVENKIIQPGDQLTMSADIGTIYYTTDGTDPLSTESSGDHDESVLIPETATKRVFVPKAESGNFWRSDVDFDDSAWLLCQNAPGGVGYETTSGYENLISLDVRNDMYSSGDSPNTSCYVRIKFQLTQNRLDQIQNLILSVLYDDGFAAYLNGFRVVQANAPTNLRWDSAATENHENAGPETFDLTNFIYRLVAGDNLLAIQALNTSTTSSDFLINAMLSTQPQGSWTGAISENAILYEDPVELTSTSLINARAYLNSNWSALSQVLLVVPSDINNLRFTEIQYHPLTADTLSNRVFEFIELKNIGSSIVDLSGARISQGVFYTFPANTLLSSGEFIVLASDVPKFYERYGFSPFGQYEGSLANEGETVTLVDVQYDTIVTVSYDDREPWPEKADGDGYSLITKEPNPGRDENDARWWRISAAIHGSPGRDDPNSTVVEKTAKLPPARFQLQQNYPNPFNPRTAIFYSIPYNAFVTLTVYDVLGREIKTLVKSFQKANDYTVSFDASQLPSGIYFYRLKAGAKFQKTRKMLLVR